MPDWKKDTLKPNSQ